MATLTRSVDIHPWRTAAKASNTVQSWPGRVFDLAVAGGSGWAALKYFGGSAAVEIVLAVLGGLLAAPLLEITWRRIRGPIGQLSNENASLVQQIDALQAESWRLRHPTPLDIHVSGFMALMNREDKCHNLEDQDDVLSVGHLITLHHLEITNKSDQDMTLDFAIVLRLNRVGIGKTSGLTTSPSPFRMVGRKHEFHNGFLALASKQTRACDTGFLWGTVAAMGSWGVNNVAADGHVLTISDRVSGRSASVPLPLSIYPAEDDVEQPEQVGREELPSEPILLPFRVGLESKQDSRIQTQHERFYLHITNDGPAIAKGVKVALRDIVPRPRSTDFLGRKQEYLGPSVGEAISASALVGTPARDLSASETASFPLLDAVAPTTVTTLQYLVWGIDGYDFGEGGTARHRATVIEPGEEWHLALTVYADNGKPQDLEVVVTLANWRITATLQEMSTSHIGARPSTEAAP